MLETFPFDAASVVETLEDAAVYMTLALQTGDAADVVGSLDVVARGLGKPEPHLAPDVPFDRLGDALAKLGLRFSAQAAVMSETAEAA